MEINNKFEMGELVELVNPCDPKRPLGNGRVVAIAMMIRDNEPHYDIRLYRFDKIVSGWVIESDLKKFEPKEK